MLLSFRNIFVTTALFSISRSQALYPLAQGDSSVLPGVGPACISAFNANASCGSAIGILVGDPFSSFGKDVLDGLCDGVCSEGLDAYRESILSACKSDSTWEDVADTSIWPVTYIVDKAIYALDLACLQRSDGQYCNVWFETGANETEAPECDECYMEVVRAQAISPVANEPAEMQSIYSSMSSSCSYSGAPVTRNVSDLVLSSPTATRECSSEYEVNSGDSVIEVSQSQQVGTHDLLTANDLPYNFTTFSSSQTLCIQNQCNVYSVKSGDTCRSIASAEGLALAELLAWNPRINGVCSNIEEMVGQTVCVTNPLGNFVLSNSTDESSQTPAPVPDNIAPDTNTNCAQYHNVVGGDDCGTLGLRYGISLEDFRFLNPMVWANCTNIWLDYSYCVTAIGQIDAYPGYDPPEPTLSFTPETLTQIPWEDVFSDSPDALVIPLASETRNDCWDYLWWNSSRGEPIDCEAIALSYEISIEQLVTWNPSLSEDSGNSTEPTLKPDCTITPSYSYCVSVASPTPQAEQQPAPPSPRGADEIEGCQRWFRASLSCEAHLALARMGIERFYEYNPSVGSDCTGFVNGTYYCWSTGASLEDDDPPTTTSAPSTTTAAPSDGATPTPTQSGMTANCNDFYLVKSGDGCWAIANDNGISVEDFYEWNPAVGTDCAGLLSGYHVCVGESASAPSSTRSSTRPSPPSPTSNVSPNGLCGGAGGYTCMDSGFGDCCSASGYCGSSADYCGSGCQGAFGSCDEDAKVISPDGLCGGSDGYTCAGSAFGNCCSSSGYCGSDSAYCGAGCQTTYGRCD